MIVVNSSVGPRRAVGRIAWALVAIAALGLPLTPPAAALLYRAPEGTIKDNCVVWNNGTYYLFAMYRYEQKARDQDQWRSVWLATSTDGVHWKDVGPVIKDAPFGIYAMRVWRVGDRFVMNHGSFTGEAQDVLRLWESPDLVRWEYLGPDYDVRRPDGGRIDHMDVITAEEDGKTVYYGYAVGGVLRSEDGLKWHWLGELPLSGDISFRVVQEPGGCQRFGDTYYLLVGGFLPGGFEYAVATYIANHPTGPFYPDYPAFRLNGYSGRELVALWAGYCRLPDETLFTNYVLDPGGQFWWHAPLKSTVVDDAGHLHMGYWHGNEALKGTRLSETSANPHRVFPDSPGITTFSEKEVAIAAPAFPHVRWITPDKPNIVCAFAGPVLDFDAGCIVEGTMRVSGTDGIAFPAAGIALEQTNQEAVAILFGTWGQTLIGRLSYHDAPHFGPADITGFGCATVAGMPAGKACSYRLLIRKGIFEVYLDDLLVQTCSGDNLTGRIGFIVQDGKGTFDWPRIWTMSLP